MFCPECKAEYRTGFTQCENCNVELVDRLSEPDPVEAGDAPEAAPSEYVVVSRVQGPVEEGQICSFLEASGIPAHTRGEVLRKTYGITVDGLGVAEILVPRELAAAALDLLARADHGELKLED